MAIDKKKLINKIKLNNPFLVSNKKTDDKNDITNAKHQAYRPTYYDTISNTKIIFPKKLILSYNVKRYLNKQLITQ